MSAPRSFGGSALNIAPWRVLALGISLLARSRHDACMLGGRFGFAVSAAFLWLDNTDAKTLSRLEMLVPAIAVAPLFGLPCGAVLGWVGWRLRQAARLKPR